MHWTTSLALAAPMATPADAPIVDPVRYLLACAGVLGLLALGLYGLRRLVVGTQRARAEGRSLAVVDQLHLGGSKRLAIVRCYDRQLVLGLGDKEISLVAELDPDQAIPALDKDSKDLSVGEVPMRPARSKAAPNPAAKAGARAKQADRGAAVNRGFGSLLDRAQRLADSLIPPRRDAGEEEFDAAPEAGHELQPVQRSANATGESRSAEIDGEPSAEIKAKVARELLAKLGPDHELLDAVRAAASGGAQRPKRRQSAQQGAPQKAQPNTQPKTQPKTQPIAKKNAKQAGAAPNAPEAKRTRKPAQSQTAPQPTRRATAATPGEQPNTSEPASNDANAAEGWLG